MKTNGLPIPIIGNAKFIVVLDTFFDLDKIQMLLDMESCLECCLMLVVKCTGKNIQNCSPFSFLSRMFVYVSFNFFWNIGSNSPVRLMTACNTWWKGKLCPADVNITFDVECLKRKDWKWEAIQCQKRKAILLTTFVTIVNYSAFKFLTLGVSDEGYCRDALCALTLLYTFLLLSLGWYLCWWTSGPVQVKTWLIKCRYQIKHAWSISKITFISYAQSQNIWKPKENQRA
jgi:hypothetical protein